MRLRHSERIMIELFANSGDPDQTPHSVASDLGLGLFTDYPFEGPRLQWVGDLEWIPFQKGLV